ncbi:MAG: DNA replication/repair protein RecF [Oscillospiraceae bacterium]|nr:DNA replication/repair protein RecF [Oscillospiraceae bacterium]
MQIKRLSLKSFRNYESEEFEFNSGVTVIYGNNAQGKTNVLEAVHLFSMGKSHRTHKDKEMILFGNDTSTAVLDFVSCGMENRSEIVINKDARKLIKVNGILIPKISVLMGRFNVVLFCPEHLALVKDQPRGRRKNLDAFISQLRPNYFSALLQYQKIVAGKNMLLGKSGNFAFDGVLDVWNEKLVSVAAEILKYRHEYIKRLEVVMAEVLRDISGGAEEFSMKYNSCVGDIDGKSSEEIRELLSDKLARSAGRERELQKCVVGPHRDDITFYINGKEARAFGSQGQQKTVALALKLAEVRIIREEIGEFPVLLLDDIMSELDGSRRGYILSEIRDMQVIITATDRDMFEGLGEDVCYIRVESGRVAD